jgi:hypothetical protein
MPTPMHNVREIRVNNNVASQSIFGFGVVLLPLKGSFKDSLATRKGRVSRSYVPF